MSRVTASGRVALEHLVDGPMHDGAALVCLGAARKRILRALEARGLVRYFPTSETWRITPFGRTAIARDMEPETGNAHPDDWEEIPGT